MDDNNSKCDSKEASSNQMDILMDMVERYQILVEVFFAHIPNKQKLAALAEAADRIHTDIKSNKDKN